jgi:hypothetical protein
MHWKVWIKAAEAGDEMIFPSANCFFRGVTSMVVRRNELEGNGFGAHGRGLRYQGVVEQV